MEVKASGKLPAPPSDLASRPLPLTRVSGPLFRIHQIVYPAAHFGKTAKHRFDDPLKEYAVLYGSVKPDAAFAETLLRRINLMLVWERDLQARALSEIKILPCRCVNLTAHGLRQISCDSRIANELPYYNTQLWSRAFYEHPNQPSGILYRSRHNPRLVCVALFSRVERDVSVSQTTPLVDPALRLWTSKQLKRYKVLLRSP
jgi:hypothetical protein